MPFVAKTAPTSVGPNGCVEINEPSYYEGQAIRPGDELFVFFSETQAGDGLDMLSIVVSAERQVTSEIRLVMRPTRMARRRLGIAELAPMRDAETDEPLAELARKLYRHSHNKVARISEQAAELLRHHFE
jgi:hypothetical protein